MAIAGFFLTSKSKRAAYRVLLLWTILVMISLPLGVAVALTYGPMGPIVSLVLFVTVGALVLFYLPHHAPHDHFGAGNSVTLVRSALVSWLAGFIFLPGVMASPIIAWSLASAGWVVLILDGVDGWLARKTGQTSRFGARFDMEIDSLFAIVLALLVWQSGKVGLWVLLLGLPRPIFVLAAWFEPRLKNPLPESIARKTICVVQIAALIVLLSPAFDSLNSNILAALALSLLGWSFWRDTRLLLGVRH